MNYTKREAQAWARDNLKGHWGTMVNPMKADGELDETGLRKNIQYSTKLGTEGMGFNWSMGEWWALTKEERKKVCEIVVDEAKGGKFLTGIYTVDPCLKDCLELTRHAEEAGADIAILSPPMISCRSEEAGYEFVKYVADRVDIGIMIFNQPLYYDSPNFTTKTFLKLAKIPNILGSKEAHANIAQTAETQRAVGDKLVIGTPDPFSFFTGLSHGMTKQGVFANMIDILIDTPSNKPYRKFFEAAVEGRMDQAAKIWKDELGPLYSIFNQFIQQGSTGPVWGMVAAEKYWHELKGLAGGPVRQPLMNLTAEQKSELKPLFDRYAKLVGLEVPLAKQAR